MGTVYALTGKDAQALECFEKAYGLFLKVAGPEHPNAVKIQQQIDAMKAKLNGPKE